MPTSQRTQPKFDGEQHSDRPAPRIDELGIAWNGSETVFMDRDEPRAWIKSDTVRDLAVVQ